MRMPNAYVGVEDGYYLAQLRSINYDISGMQFGSMCLSGLKCILWPRDCIAIVQTPRKQRER